MNDKLSDRSQKQAGEQSLLITRRINNPCQDSRMLLATKHSANGQVTQRIKREFGPQGVLSGIYADLLHRQG